MDINEIANNIDTCILPVYNAGDVEVVRNLCGNIAKDKLIRIYTVLKDYFETSGSGYGLEVCSVGSGNGDHEYLLQEGVGLKVVCYDKKPPQVDYGLTYREVIFPKDNYRIFPEDCQNVILFAAYPEGYLGKLLELYREKGGRKICLVVEGYYGTDLHAGCEPDEGDVLREQMHAVHDEYPKFTSLIIGSREGSVSDACMVFYGDWDHKKLQSLWENNLQKDAVAGASGRYCHGM